MDISIEDKIELLFKENKELKERLLNIKNKNKELEEILDEVKDELNIKNQNIEQEFDELFNERFNEIEMKNEELDDFIKEFQINSDKNLKKIYFEIKNITSELKKEINEELIIIKKSIMNMDNIIVSLFDYIEIEKKRKHKNNLINIIGFIGIISIICYKFAY